MEGRGHYDVRPKIRVSGPVSEEHAKAIREGSPHCAVTQTWRNSLAYFLDKENYKPQMYDDKQGRALTARIAIAITKEMKGETIVRGAHIGIFRTSGQPFTRFIRWLRETPNSGYHAFGKFFKPHYRIYQITCEKRDLTQGKSTPRCTGDNIGARKFISPTAIPTDMAFEVSKAVKFAQKSTIVAIGGGELYKEKKIASNAHFINVEKGDTFISKDENAILAINSLTQMGTPTETELTVKACAVIVAPTGQPKEGKRLERYNRWAENDDPKKILFYRQVLTDPSESTMIRGGENVVRILLPANAVSVDCQVLHHPPIRYEEGNRFTCGAPRGPPGSGTGTQNIIHGIIYFYRQVREYQATKNQPGIPVRPQIAKAGGLTHPGWQDYRKKIDGSLHLFHYLNDRLIISPRTIDATQATIYYDGPCHIDGPARQFLLYVEVVQVEEVLHAHVVRTMEYDGHEFAPNYQLDADAEKKFSFSLKNGPKIIMCGKDCKCPHDGIMSRSGSIETFWKKKATTDVAILELDPSFFVFEEVDSEKKFIQHRVNLWRKSTFSDSTNTQDSVLFDDFIGRCDRKLTSKLIRTKVLPSFSYRPGGIPQFVTCGFSCKLNNILRSCPQGHVITQCEHAKLVGKTSSMHTFLCYVKGCGQETDVFSNMANF